MTPRNGSSRRGGLPPADATATTNQTPRTKPAPEQPTAAAVLPVAVGEYFPPAGRRRLGAILVRRCPGCGHAHFHRGMRVAGVDGETRTGSCGTDYKIRVGPAQRIGGAA